MLRQWKQDAEERALGECLLHLLGLSRDDVDKLYVPELSDEIRSRVERFDSNRCTEVEVRQEVTENKEIESIEVGSEKEEQELQAEVLTHKEPVKMTAAQVKEVIRARSKKPVLQ